MLSRNRVRPLLAFWLGTLALAVPSHLSAENGRNFAGYYQLHNASTQGSFVTVKLSVKLFNYSGADLNDATISLSNPVPEPALGNADFQGSFDGVSVRYRRFVNLEGSFTVPDSEYHQWQKGASPNLTVTYVDEAGRETHDKVELTKAR